MKHDQIKHILVVFAVFVTGAVVPIPAQARPRPTMNDLARSSDLIVEGVVYQESESSNKFVQENVGVQGTSMVLKFTPVKTATIYLTKVYKGPVKPNQTITVFYDVGKSRNTIDLGQNNTFVFFLERPWNRQGYEIADRGRGHWRIFDYEGKKKLKAWNQDCRLRNADSYPDYDVFVGDLKQNLSQIAYSDNPDMIFIDIQK